MDVSWTPKDSLLDDSETCCEPVDPFQNVRG